MLERWSKTEEVFGILTVGEGHRIASSPLIWVGEPFPAYAVRGGVGTSEYRGGFSLLTANLSLRTDL
jgi:hypothetical protein